MRTSVRIAITTVMAVVIVYTLAGFFLAPYLLKRQIITDLSERTGGTVTLGQSSVNPFLLSANLSQISIDTPDTQALLTLESVYIRLDIASLWRRGWVIREMLVDKPYLQVASLPEWYKAGDSVPLASINHLHVRQGRLQWMEPTAGAVAGAMINLTDVEFTLKNLGGKPYKAGQFTLAAVVNRSGWLRSSGSLRPSPDSLDATLELGEVDLADLDSTLAFGNDSGQPLKVFSALLSGKFNVHLEHGQASVHGQAGLDRLELLDRSTNATVFSAANVQADKLAIQGIPFRTSVGVLHLHQPHLTLVRDVDGSLRGGHWLKPLFDGSTGLQPAIPRIEIQDGSLNLADQSLAPSYQLKTGSVKGSITRQGRGTAVSISGRVMGGSESVIEFNWRPTGSHDGGRLDVSIGELDATVLSPYMEAVTGRGINSGQLDMRFTYQEADQQFNLENEISALGFHLDEEPTNPVTPGIQGRLPLDLAIALARDNNDRITISIPVPAGRIKEGMHPGVLVSEGLVNLVQNLTNEPFNTLGKLNGNSPPYLERIVFMPGDAALPEAAIGKLVTLASALAQRPGLGLKISGRFDDHVDRQALARKQVALHIALASSAGPPGREAPSSIDLDNSKVISVLNEFAGKRLNMAELEVLHASHPQRGSAFYAAVFEALVKNEAVSRTKLNALARYRAQTIVDQLKAAGVEPQRLQIGKETKITQAHNRTVLVELEVTLL